MSFLGKLFSPKPAESKNLAYGQLNSTYGPTTQTGVGATNFLGQMLMQGGNAESGYQNYLDKAGYAPALHEMQRQVTGSQAGAGMLNSGSTIRRQLTEGSKINNSYYNNYLQQLAGLAGIGLQGGQLIANAGQTSTGARESTAAGIGRAVGTAAQVASLFSDARLKTDIKLVDHFPDGLGVYDYRYKGSNEVIRGVMAHEVAELRPHALGPSFLGYQTVDYGAL